MSPREFLRRFPNASKSSLEANCGAGVDTKANRVSAPEPDDQPHQNIKGVSVTILGQIRGGKNNMIVTKGGKHIPKKPWAKWRDDAVAQVRSQLPASWDPISTPTNVMINYVAGDRKRRDFPAICDAIWHVLEKAGFVLDDTLLWPAKSSRSYDKESPHATISVYL